MKLSYFPILIVLTESKLRETLVCNSPRDIPSGIPFKVLKLNYKSERLEYSEASNNLP